MSKLAFVCVGNAGRSQMATAYAEAERRVRGLTDSIELVTGGIEPKDTVHDTVIDALDEDGIDISDRTPRRIEQDDVIDATHIITMGCDPSGVIPSGFEGVHERWQLSDPDGEGFEAVREQRNDIKRRVYSLFERVEGEE